MCKTCSALALVACMAITSLVFAEDKVLERECQDEKGNPLTSALASGQITTMVQAKSRGVEAICVTLYMVCQQDGKQYPNWIPLYWAKNKDRPKEGAPTPQCSNNQCRVQHTMTIEGCKYQ